eukprot:59357_1
MDAGKSTTIDKIDSDSSPSNDDGYILVGQDGQWDPSKCPTMIQKRGRTKEEKEEETFYYISITVDKPFTFQIVHSKHHWDERWYPPGSGDTAKHISRAEKGDGEVGHGKGWRVDNIPSGQQISIYFSPTSKCVTWTTQPDIDPQFQMPHPPKINDDSIWAATQFNIKPQDDPLSKTLLTAVSKEAAIVITILHALPYVILSLLFLWVYQVAAKFYQVSIYKEGMKIEWVNVIVVYLCIFAPKAYDTFNSLTVVREVIGVARKITNHPKLVRGMYFAAFLEFINLLQPIFALGLSIYIALFLSENIFLNVVLNTLALEFIASVDEALIAVYIKERFGDSFLSFVLVDLQYAKGIHEENDFWNESQLAKSTVLDTLKSGDISNAMRWSLITSISKGLGLLGVLPNNRDERRKVENPNAQCVNKVEIELNVLNWNKVGEAEIIASGGLFLSATTEFTWESIISKQQKGLLFKYVPEIAMKFAWKGCLKMSLLGLNNSHAPALARIINSNDEVIEIDLRGNTNIGHEGVKILSDKLKNNKRLKKLSFHQCDIDNVSAKYIAELFRENTALKYIWLLDNENITDEGALSIMQSLVDRNNDVGGSYNSTLNHVYMNGTGVSEECKQKCIEMTGGRMCF